MDISANFNDIFKFFIVFMTIGFTLAYLNKIMVVITSAIHGQKATITNLDVFIPTFFWSLYIMIFW